MVIYRDYSLPVSILTRPYIGVVLNLFILFFSLGWWFNLLLYVCFSVICVHK